MRLKFPFSFCCTGAAIYIFLYRLNDSLKSFGSRVKNGFASQARADGNHKEVFLKVGVKTSALYHIIEKIGGGADIISV